MKVAIVGSSGYIASFLFDRFKRESYIDFILKIDQTNNADVFLNLWKPAEFDYSVLQNIDIIIFTAAISSPDKCASDFDVCWKINVEGTKYFIEKAVEQNCRVLFFSSDAVFGNNSEYIYTELSETKATTAYGKMKKTVEDAYKENPQFKAVRLSYVVSEKDRFVNYCLNCIKEHKIAEVFHPFYRNCIVISDVVDIVVWFLQHWDQYKPFVLNAAGGELISRVRIADEINRYLGNCLEYTICRPEEKFFANRPKLTQMESLYIQKYQIIKDSNSCFTKKFQKELKSILFKYRRKL